ncbi:MAG: DUF58 domain-containing protein [Gemmatimonadales bacterium]|nr:DUF58 domain-containing protein [Gemmatimonadales bacterium]
MATTTPDLSAVERLELATRQLVRDLAAGDAASAKHGRGVDFGDVREYAAGDDVRGMDWRVTARMGTAHVRLREEERELTMLVALDCTASALTGSRGRTRRELAAEVGAVLALAGAWKHAAVGLALVDGGVRAVESPRRGHRHALRLAGLLLDAPLGAGSFADGLAALDRLVKRRTLLVLLSDFEDPGLAAPIVRLARRHEVIGIQVTDALERRLPGAGLVALEDPETGERQLVDTDDPGVRSWLAARLASLDHDLGAAFVAADGDLLRLDASAPYAEPLLAFFRRRARRR